MSLDGFSMHALVKELSRALIGGRIDKITQPNKQTIILSVRQPGRLALPSANTTNDILTSGFPGKTGQKVRSLFVFLALLYRNCPIRASANHKMQIDCWNSTALPPE